MIEEPDYARAKLAADRVVIAFLDDRSAELEHRTARRQCAELIQALAAARARPVAHPERRSRHAASAAC